MKTIDDMITIFIANRDKKIYQKIMSRKQPGFEGIYKLYLLNQILSKELFMIVSQLEKLFKYKLHQKMTQDSGQENWFNLIDWSENVIKILEHHARFLPTPITPENFWDGAPIGFLKHLFDHEYVHTLYYGGINTIFDNCPAKTPLKRTTLKKIFIRAAGRKSDLIFGRIIINDEKELLRDYRKFMQCIYWLDKDYFYITAKTSRFIEYYRLLTAFDFGEKNIF